MTEYDDELMKLAQTISRRVRCLLIYCERCDLKVLRVEEITATAAKLDCSAARCGPTAGCCMFSQTEPATSRSTVRRA